MIPGEHSERQAYKRFIAGTSAAIVLSFIGVFLGMAIRNDALIRETLLARARSLFQQIVLARKWNASYGGVYVLKGPGVESNPWLVNPDIRTADGRVLTKRNPALMTREISEIAAREANFRFHITSLKPLNPGNAPDEFERKSLESFEAGITETWGRVMEGERAVYRYMGALIAEESCLQCHAVQGYKLGDIRGGISVSFGVEEIARAQRQNIIIIVVSGSAVIGGLLYIVIRIIRGLKRRLDEAREELRQAAVRDALTGIHNRRYVLGRLEEEFAKSKRTREALCCALVDADDFKKVNDELGHLAGDAALKGIASVMAKTIRPYDLLGRYGGEEFILAFPSTRGTEAEAACERIRARIESELSAVAGNPPRGISVSIGVAEIGPEDSLDNLLGRADKALYQSKMDGKNRVTLWRKPS